MAPVEAARRWRETWERAWPAKDVAAVTALYAADATYRSHPFREPEASAEVYIERVFSEAAGIECRFGAPIVAGDRAAVEWWATYAEAGKRVSLCGVTVLRFGPGGLVQEHLDYWVEGEGRREPSARWGA